MRGEHIFPWFLAVLAGAAAPALINAVLAGPDYFSTAFLFAFIVTLAHAVILGLPVAFLYRSQGWTGVLGALIGGFLIGAVPVGFMSLPREVADHIPSSEDYLRYLQSLSLFGGYGAVGALAFWSTLWWLGMLKIADREPAGSEPV